MVSYFRLPSDYSSEHPIDNRLCLKIRGELRLVSEDAR